MQELKWSLLKRPGGVLQVRISSVDADPRTCCQTSEAYYKKFRAMLAPFRPWIRTDVIVASPGGVVYSAFGMAKALLDEHRPIRVLLNGFCGSAGSFFVGIADKGECCIIPEGRVYIHASRAVRCVKTGIGWEFRAALTKLSITNAMISFYRSRLHWPRRDVRRMITESRRFTAQEAVDAGLCDRIVTLAEFEREGQA